VYDLAGTDLPLKQPIAVALPIHPPPNLAQPEVVVEVLDAIKGWRQVPGVVDPTTHSVRALTDRLGPIRVSWDDARKLSLNDLLHNPVNPMPVPYYPQLGNPWCFAAASQMLLKYYGKAVEIWDVAREFKLTTEHGAPVSWLSDTERTNNCSHATA
jgi:hypothetical protein